MSDELKPCPFCGGAVSLERTRDTRDEILGVRQWWGVVCRNTENLGGSCAIEQRPSASKEAAIERWNHRANAAASVVPELTADIAADRHFIAGVKLGWNFCDAGDEKGFQQCIEGRLAQIREASAATSMGGA